MDDRLLLQVKGLRTWFHTFKGVVKAVDDVSFDIRVGEVLAVVGEAGGGKSVTGFSVIRLIDEPGRIESGEVLFAGRDLMKLSEREMNRVRGKDISMVFQDAMTSLNPVYTIGQQIDEVLRLHTSMGRSCGPSASRTRRGGWGATPISFRAVCASGSSSPSPLRRARASSSRTSPRRRWM